MLILQIVNISCPYIPITKFGVLICYVMIKSIKNQTTICNEWFDCRGAFYTVLVTLCNGGWNIAENEASVFSGILTIDKLNLTMHYR